MHMLNNLALIQVSNFSSIKPVCLFYFPSFPPSLFSNPICILILGLFRMFWQIMSLGHIPLFTQISGGRRKQGKTVIKVLYSFSEKKLLISNHQKSRKGRIRLWEEMRINWFKFVLDYRSSSCTLNLLSESSIEAEKKGWWERRWIACSPFLTLIY